MQLSLGYLYVWLCGYIEYVNASNTVEPVSVVVVVPIRIHRTKKYSIYKLFFIKQMKYLLLLLISLPVIYSSDTCTCNEGCAKKGEIGKGTWNLLHEIVKHHEANEENNFHLAIFIESLSHIYPCEECRKHMREIIEETMKEEKMPEMSELWMCNFHNTVNERLGKELYNCDEFIPS
jgi:hypothetical protein